MNERLVADVTAYIQAMKHAAEATSTDEGETNAGRD